MYIVEIEVPTNECFKIRDISSLSWTLQLLCCRFRVPFAAFTSAMSLGLAAFTPETIIRLGLIMRLAVRLSIKTSTKVTIRLEELHSINRLSRRIKAVKLTKCRLLLQKLNLICDVKGYMCNKDLKRGHCITFL